MYRSGRLSTTRATTSREYVGESPRRQAGSISMRRLQLFYRELVVVMSHGFQMVVAGVIDASGRARIHGVARRNTQALAAGVKQRYPAAWYVEH